MRVISSSELRNNMKKYLDLAIQEKIVIQRGRNETFVLTKEEYLEPDEDLRRAICAKELLAGIETDIREESAVQYVRKLILDIEYTLPSRTSKIAPAYFERHGKNMRYSTFRKNKNTEWYVFFNKYEENGEIIYLVRFIGNNHTLAKYL